MPQTEKGADGQARFIGAKGFHDGPPPNIETRRERTIQCGSAPVRVMRKWSFRWPRTRVEENLGPLKRWPYSKQSVAAGGGGEKGRGGLLQEREVRADEAVGGFFRAAAAKFFAEPSNEQEASLGLQIGSGECGAGVTEIGDAVG